MKGQLDLFDEIIVDNFAGGGGASTGIEIATGRVVNIAINHDPQAILMHQTNHPYTEHYQESVWNINPVEVCGGRPVGLAWFSPDCKHFSKAKGAALVDKNIRGLAWIVLKWAGTVRPRVIILENVEEFTTWCPVRKGKPVKSKTGQTFQKWLKQLQDLGYDVKFKTLVAADYGTPTSRKRFFCVARCDGKPIVFPKPTHAPADDPRVLNGELKPWVSAANIINWSLPCPSIFDTKQEIFEKHGLKAVRPLADNTLRRIARGLDKYVIKSAKPFIVECNHSGAGHIKSVDNAVGTITQKCTMGLCSAYMAQAKFENNPQDIQKPLSTITSVGAHELVMPIMAQYHSEQGKEVRAYSLDKPLLTADGSNRYGLIAPYLTKYFSGDGGQRADASMATITTRDRENLCFAHIAEFKGTDKGQPADVPLRTITAGDGEFGVIKTKIARMDAGSLGKWDEVRKLLNKFCDYNIAEDEVLIFTVNGEKYFICDIGLRMLTPKELYKAMGFPEDYIIDRDYLGNEYKRANQVARCGNAVCPPIASAIVRANLPEYCESISITTMNELLNMVAV